VRARLRARLELLIVDDAVTISVEGEVEAAAQLEQRQIYGLVEDPSHHFLHALPYATGVKALWKLGRLQQRSGKGSGVAAHFEFVKYKLARVVSHLLLHVEFVVDVALDEDRDQIHGCEHVIVHAA